MSNEFDDSADQLQQGCNRPPRTAPTAGRTAPGAAGAGAATAAAAAPDDAPPPPPTANVGRPGGRSVEAALRGEPDSLPLTFCKVCKVEVLPIGKGRCGRCGTFLRLNFARRLHPVNVLRRDAILADLLAQFPPANVLERTTCERLAGATEQLESIKPGSPEWQRLVQMEQTLSASLHDARLSREAVRTPDVIADESDDELIARTISILHALLDRRDAPRAVPHEARDAGSPVQATTLSEGVAPTSAPAPQPAPICPYCQRACVGPEHEAYSVLHWRDPDEVQKRAERATKEMMQQLGKPLPDWYQ